MLYFAYGSNLHPTRLRERVPGVALEGVAVAQGRRLAFHKRGFRDGSAKCDLPETSPPVQAYGALYRIASDHRLGLARIEGAGAGYEETSVEVDANGKRVSAFLFLAQPEFVDPALIPFDWYKALVLEGAKYHQFPAAYTAAIKNVPCLPDPDHERAATNWELVARIRRDAR
jgi:hypothetical protein